MLRVLDLFSGIGGFSLGLERTGGFRTVAFCEIIEHRRLILARHWPDVPCFSDITKLRGEDAGPVDVVCGGYPCKQTSTAAAVHGRRNLLDGKDSRLWFDMLRVIDECRSSWVIVENPDSEAFGTVQEGLAGTGYRSVRLAASAVEHGLPHLRRRVFALAHRDGARLEIARRSWERAAPTPEGLAAARRAWLQSIPGTLRAPDGLPRRMDRIEGIGNSVVPTKVTRIGRAILEAQASRNEAA